MEPDLFILPQKRTSPEIELSTSLHRLHSSTPTYRGYELTRVSSARIAWGPIGLPSVGVLEGERVNCNGLTGLRI